MNFEKYCKEQFDSRGRDTLAARQLADELVAEVNAEIHTAVLPVFMRLVKGLNALGHNLTEYDPITPGDIAFRDEPTDGDCYLRLGCNVVISAGYSHTMTADEAYAEFTKDALESNAI
jgi:hypothetical protein